MLRSVGLLISGEEGWAIVAGDPERLGGGDKCDTDLLRPKLD